jgi:hypothetical protein
MHGYWYLLYSKGYGRRLGIGVDIDWKKVFTGK